MLQIYVRSVIEQGIGDWDELQRGKGEFMGGVISIFFWGGDYIWVNICQNS